MKQIFLAALLVGITALSACTNETRPANETAAKAAADSAAKPAMLAQPSTTPSAQPGAPTTTPPAGANSAINTKNADGSVALNPPHGQPNHRCDIAVGAPLDSPPGANAGGGGMPSSGTPIQVTPGNGSQTVQVNPQSVQVNPQTVQVNPQSTPAKPQQGPAKR